MQLVTSLVFCIAFWAQHHYQGKDVVRAYAREFQFPVRFDRDRQQEIDELHLYVSTDRGKTWTKAVEAARDQKFISYTAPSDGLYWFTLQVICKDTSKQPEDVSKSTAIVKVRVDTSPVVRISHKPITEGKESASPLEQEVKALQAKVKELEKRLVEIEKRGKP